MPAAMHLTVLVALFAVTVWTGINASDELVTKVTTSAAHRTSLAATTNVKTTNNTQQPPTTHRNTSEEVSSSPLPSTSPQAHPSVTPPHTATTNQTSSGTVSHRSTLPPASGSPNSTATTSTNTTSTGFVHQKEKGGLAANAGLVTVLCIFCIVLALALVVATVKCIRSQRPNFERLEDVPMSKVNEQSPFAQYSK